MSKYVVFIFLTLTLKAELLDYALFPNPMRPNDIKGIVIHDVKEIKGEVLNELYFAGISDLSYCNDQLFALSDRGALFRLDVRLENKKITTFKLVEAYVLKGKNGKPLKHDDAEGLDCYDEGLVVSFERKPRLLLMSKQGVKKEKLPLSPALQDIKNYQKKNKALEAVIFDENYGYITAPEIPLKGENEGLHRLYSSSRTWQFEARGQITALEHYDEGLIILERSFSFLNGQHIILSRLNLTNCKENRVCLTKVLAQMRSEDGWYLDNFEGLAHIKDDLYLMISDDNESIFQKTLLMLFEIKRAKM